MKKTEKVKNKGKNGLDGKAQQNVKKEQPKMKINVKRDLQVCGNVEAKKNQRRQARNVMRVLTEKTNVNVNTVVDRNSKQNKKGTMITYQTMIMC